MLRTKLVNVAIIVGSTCLGVVLGFIVGNALEQRVLAMTLGFLTGIPLGLAVVQKQNRWVAVALLLDILVLTYVNGHWVGLGLTGVAIILGFFVSSSLTKDLFGGGNEFVAMWEHVLLALNRTLGIQEIDNGKTVVPAKADRLLGPRLIKIRPGNAIVLAKGRQPTTPPSSAKVSSMPQSHTLAVVGPGEFTSGTADYIVAIYDLRDRQKAFTFEAVQTADLVATRIQAEVIFALDVRDEARLGDSSLLSTEEENLRRITLSTLDWEEMAKCVIESNLRHVIGQQKSLDILAGQVGNRFSDRIRQLADQELKLLGIRLKLVLITNMQKQ